MDFLSARIARRHLRRFIKRTYAKSVKQAVGIPVIAARLITNASEGEALLLGGVCDAVAYGRELLRNPNFAQAAMSELGCTGLIENSYKRAFK